MRAHLWEVFLLGVGKVLRVESDAWSTVKLLRQASNEYTPSTPPPKVHLPLTSLNHTKKISTTSRLATGTIKPPINPFTDTFR